MFGPAVTVEGVEELRRRLRSMQVEGANRALRVAHRNVAKDVEGRTRGRGTRQQVSAAKALLGRGRPDRAELAIRNLASVPYGLVAFMGSPRRTGWAARARRGRRQHLPWVGADWDINAGTGPYVIRDVLASDRERIVERFVDEMRSAAEALGLDWD